jgi:zinc/manganese transport system ATP-binding protein
LLSLIARVLQPRTGTVDLCGHRDIAFAVQRSQVTDTFPLTVGEAVMMGRWRSLGLLRRPSRADRDIVAAWLSELGLLELSGRRLGDLSGGQRQTVLLAQAFVQQAPILLLDEPTTGLDSGAAASVNKHLLRLAEAGTAIVAATHDPAVVANAHHHIEMPL